MNWEELPLASFLGEYVQNCYHLSSVECTLKAPGYVFFVGRLSVTDGTYLIQIYNVHYIGKLSCVI